MTYFNEFGQARLGWRTGGGGITPSTLWNSIYSVYNADSIGSSSLKTSLVSAYNGESNANDSFGSNNGTPMGGLTYTTGKIGNAFNFNGSTSYVKLPTNSFKFTSSEDFSISLWIWMTSPNQNTQFIFSNSSFDGTNQYGYYLYQSGGSLIFRIGSSSGLVSLSTAVDLVDKWSHITITRKASTGTKIYVNGTLATSNTNTQNPNYLATMIPSIGAGDWGSTYGVSYYCNNGTKLDALNIWNKELTQSEITELYNSGNGSQYITDNFYKPTTNDALNTYNGTAQGGLTYGVGKVGTAFVGNGSNAYVSLPNNSFNFQTFSINAWVYLSSSTTRSTFMGNYYYTLGGMDYGWIFEHTSSGNVRCYMQTPDGTPLVVSTSYSGRYNSWKMITVTILKNNALRLYIDGVLITTNYNPPNINYNTTNYSTVCGYISNSTLTGTLENGGKVDAVGIWNKELSASEITELYNSGNGKQYPN